MQNDLESLSDEELERIAAGGSGFSDDMENMSDEELAKLALGGKADPSVLTSVVTDYIAPVGKFIDKYTGAPVRKGIGSLQMGGGPIDAIKAAASQFGEDPDLAPTGKDIAIKSGFSETPLSDRYPGIFNNAPESQTLFKKGGVFDVSPAGVAGLGVDVAADWTNILPVSAAAKLSTQAVKESLPVVGSAIKGAAKGVATVADVGTGTKVGSKGLEAINAGADFVGNTVKGIKEHLTPTVSDEFSSYLEKARSLGLDEKDLLEAHKYGQNSFITRATRSQAEGALGQPILNKFDQTMGKLKDATDKTIESAAGTQKLDAFSAGKGLEKDLDAYRNEVFKKDDISYKKATDYVEKAGGQLQMNRDAMAKFASTINGMEKEAKGLMSNRNIPEVRRQGKDMMGYINAIKKGSDSIEDVLTKKSKQWSYKQFVETMQDVGKVAFPDRELSSKLPYKTDELKKLYFSMRDAVIDTVGKDISPDLAKELVDNNQKYSEYLNNLRELPNLKESPAERVVSTAFSNTDRIEALKKVVSPESFKKLAGSWAKDRVPVNAEGNINWASFKNELSNNEPLWVSALGQDHVNKLKNAADLGVGAGMVKMSTSGTSAGNAFRELPSKFADAVYSQKITDKMKEIADRGIDKQIPVSVNPVATSDIPVDIDAASSAAQQMGINPEVVRNYMKLKPSRFAGLRESPLATGLKGSQAVSIHDRNSRRVGYDWEKNYKNQQEKFVEPEKRRQDYINNN